MPDSNRLERLINMIELISYYQDEKGNKWSIEKFTLNQAMQASESLVGCTDCTDCKDCMDCMDCTDCKNCKNCAYCTDCKDCTVCAYCINCEFFRNQVGERRRRL